MHDYPNVERATRIFVLLSRISLFARLLNFFYCMTLSIIQNSCGMESSKETGCQAPILCVNNCGFFGSATTMNMCSKCHRDMILNQRQAQIAASSIESIVNGGSTSNEKAPVFADATTGEAEPIDSKAAPQQSSSDLLSSKNEEPKAKQGPSRCATCSKRVGLTGFKCKCGDLYCSIHRYADKHACPFDYQAAGRDAIAKANPLVRGEKLDKI